LRQDNNPPRSVGKPLEHVVALLTARGPDGVLMGRALPCLLRIVAACPRSRFMRVGASHSRRSLDAGRSSSSNLVDGTHVPRNAPGTPQANGPVPGVSHPAAPSPDKQTHRWPPRGQAADPGQRCDPADPPTVRQNARADPLGHRCVMEPAITRELRCSYSFTSARLRTPPRCWREYARAH